MLLRRNRIVAAVIAVVLAIGVAMTGAPAEAAPAEKCNSLKTFIKCLAKETKSVKKAKASSGAPESGVTQSNYEYTVEEYMDYIIADVDKTWSKWFTTNGFEEPLTWIVKIEPNDPAFVSLCGLTVESDKANAFYCPDDWGTDANGVLYQGALVLPVLTFQKMWTGKIFGSDSATIGDFAAAYILAHEFGHAVQDELKLQIYAQLDRQMPEFSSPNKELIADCFAGVWMTSAYYSKVMEVGDIDEAIAAAEAIGDKAGVEYVDPHGTPAQRKQALLTGYLGIKGKYKAGDPIACVAKYWK